MICGANIDGSIVYLRDAIPADTWKVRTIFKQGEGEGEGAGRGLKELGKLSKASLRFPREYIKQDYLGI